MNFHSSRLKHEVHLHFHHNNFEVVQLHNKKVGEKGLQLVLEYLLVLLLGQGLRLGLEMR